MNDETVLRHWLKTDNDDAAMSRGRPKDRSTYWHMTNPTSVTRSTQTAQTSTDNAFPDSDPIRVRNSNQDCHPNPVSCPLCNAPPPVISRANRQTNVGKT